MNSTQENAMRFNLEVLCPTKIWTGIIGQEGGWIPL